jgi:hypothetical protein
MPGEFKPEDVEMLRQLNDVSLIDFRKSVKQEMDEIKKYSSPSDVMVMPGDSKTMKQMSALLKYYGKMRPILRSESYGANLVSFVALADMFAGYNIYQNPTDMLRWAFGAVTCLITLKYASDLNRIHKISVEQKEKLLEFFKDGKEINKNSEYRDVYVNWFGSMYGRIDDGYVVLKD